MITTLVSLIIAAGSAGAIFGIYNYLNANVTSSIDAERKEMMSAIDDVSQELEELLRFQKGYAAQGQYDTLSGQVTSLENDLEGERSGLKGLETKLDSAQQNVETKEAGQQELKSAKEEDERKLEQLLGSYQSISDESINLEQQLAQSMKNLDALLSELDLNEEQQGLLDDLSQALSQAGETLRNLLTEYQSVKERLDMLKEQHDDLEEEYTKLVEQQLGE